MKVKCECECHEPGSAVMHYAPCCSGGFIEIRNPQSISPDPFEKILERPLIDRICVGLLHSAEMSIPINVDKWSGLENFKKEIGYDPMVVTFGSLSSTVNDGSEPPPPMAFLVMPDSFIGKTYRLTPTTHEVEHPREKPLPPAMTVSQFIEQLTKLKDENGDLPVVVCDKHGTQSYPVFDFMTRACRLPDESSAIVIGSVFLANPAIA